METMIQNPVIQAITERRSVRRYTGEKLTQEQLETIAQCALWAPSAMNQQTTKIVVTQDRALIEELGADAGRQGFDYGAPCFVFFYGQQGNKWGTGNAALAVQNAALAAQSMGLGSVVIGCVYDYLQSAEGKAKWNAKLGVPESHEFILGLLVGHPAETPAAKERLQENLIWK